MTVYIAYSGGLDSHCLLHMLAHKQIDLSSYHIANPQDIKAIHIHHGLSSNADAWQKHCVHVCEHLFIPLICEKITIDQNDDKGIEASARKLRYDVFSQYLQVGDVLLTAHHLDDQAETFLLQALRGSGVTGLSAMPESKALAKGRHIRPLLRWTRQDLKAYANLQQLQWIEDESNQDSSFRRNFIRQHIMPSLKSKWSQAAHLLSRSSAHCAEAHQILAEVAAKDLQQCLEDNNRVSINALKQFSLARQKQILRLWWQQSTGTSLDSIHLQRLLEEVIAAKEDATPEIIFNDFSIRRFNGVLFITTNVKLKPIEEISWHWRENLRLGDNVLSYIETNAGLNTKELPPSLSVRNRILGEKVHLMGHQQRKSLKNLMQQWQVPPWERETLALIFAGDILIAAPPYYHATCSKDGNDVTISFVLQKGNRRK